MKLNNYLKVFNIYFFKNKINICLIGLFTILISIIFFCISYYNGVKNLWDKWINNSYDFSLSYIVFDDEIISQKVLLNKIKNNPHVRDIFLYDSFFGSAVIEEFSNSNMSGEISIMGTIIGNKKMLYGREFNEKNTMEIICPSNFFPDSIYVNNSYNSKETIDLKKYLDKTIKIKYLGEYDITMKLVGIIDSTYDYSEPNICYVSHSTLKKLNNLYQPNLNIDAMPIYLQLDDISSIDDIKKYDGVMDVVQVKKIKNDVVDRIINIISVSIFITIIVMFSLSYLIYTRKINNQYKQIGIMKIVGYKTKIIKSIYYLEILIISLVSVIMSYFIVPFISNKFIEIFLYSDPQFSNMNLSVSPYSFLITLILTNIILFFSTTIALKKIDKFEVRDVIYE